VEVALTALSGRAIIVLAIVAAVGLLVWPHWLASGTMRVVGGWKQGRMYVQAREGEPFEELYRRFKRGMEASGLLREYRRKQRFIPAHEERRDKIRSAARKKKRALAKSGRRDGWRDVTVLLAWPRVNPAELPWHQMLEVPMWGPVLVALVVWLWLLWRAWWTRWVPVAEALLEARNALLLFSTSRVYRWMRLLGRWGWREHRMRRAPR
jgi:ribosomal protein S21